MFDVWLVLVLAALNSDAPPPDRLATRLRLDVSGLGAFRASRSGIGGGLGASADLGLVLDDLWLPFIHADATVFFGPQLSFNAGGGVDVAFGDHVSLGLGIDFSAWATVVPGSSDSFLGVTFPLRVRVGVQPRVESDTSRSGLVLGFLLAPGFTNELRGAQPGNRLPPGLGLRFGVTLGVGSW